MRPAETELLSLAQILSDKASSIACHYYHQTLDLEKKPDQSPVTIADREIEQCLREIIEAKRPHDGILGEEFGDKPSSSGLTWVLDPIDGTKNFTIGRPSFGSLIALCDGNIPILGIIDQPITKERWIGQKNQPTLYNGQPVRTRACPDLSRAICGTGSPEQINRNDPMRAQRVREKIWYMVYHGDCIFYGLLANGRMDIVVEDQLALYDFMALIPIIEGAGGIICDWQGHKLDLNNRHKKQGGYQVLALGDAKWQKPLIDILETQGSSLAD
jgi:inositol-phosphate phosphatase / L-galactose 1-phosphate phosphatase / histidinol-phosphatase